MSTTDSIRFDRAIDYYDATRGFPAGEEVAVAEMIAAAAGLNGKSLLLEVGIGTGRLGLPLSAHAGRVVGLDLSRPMMEVLRAKPSGERVRLIEGNATQLPFAEGVFDAVLAVHVFHLIPNWVTGVNEVARVLGPNGVMIHGRNQLDSDSGRLKVLQSAWQQAAGHADQHLGISREQRKTFLADSGWRQIGQARRHRFTRQVTPRDYVERLEQRMYSSTWRMSDDTLQKGVAAVWAAIDKHFSSPDEEVDVNTGFIVEVYAPPTWKSL